MQYYKCTMAVIIILLIGSYGIASSKLQMPTEAEAIEDSVYAAKKVLRKKCGDDIELKVQKAEVGIISNREGDFHIILFQVLINGEVVGEVWTWVGRKLVIFDFPISSAEVISGEAC